MIPAIIKKQQELIPYASWDQWNPNAYLKTYFSKVGAESRETLKFLVRELKHSNKHPRKVLDFGAGPTIFGALPTVPYSSEIHIADYLHSNLDEIKKWINNEQGAFNWDLYIRYIIELEGDIPTKESIKNKAEQLRQKAKKLVRCDASLPSPLGTGEKYPLVLSIFCADSATSSKEIWKIFMKNILNLVTPTGQILVAALRNCSAYKNGNHFFPCAHINENDLKGVLIESGILSNNIKLEICNVPECSSEGFTSIIFANAHKGPDTSEVLKKNIKMVHQTSKHN